MSFLARLPQPECEDRMAKQFIYFYFMKKDAEMIRRGAPSHVEYWKTRGLSQYMGGPFSDQSGGLITFETASLDQAIELVEADPFVRGDLLEVKWVREWMPE